MGFELEKITNIIQELENQTKELNHFSEVLRKIDGLSDAVENLIAKAKDNSKEHESLVLELEKRKKGLDDEMKEVMLIAKQTNDNIEIRFNKLEENFNEKVNSLSKNINIDEKIESIVSLLNENNKVLASKLENNQRTIVDELNKLKEQVNKKKGFIF